MTVSLELLKVVGVPVIVAAIGSAGGMWAYLTARHSAKLSAPAQVVASQASMVSALNAQTTILLRENAKDRRVLKRRLDRQEEQLSRVSIDVADCKAEHAKCEAKLAEVQVELHAKIDNMMKGEVPDYTELSRGGVKGAPNADDAD